MNAKQFTSAAVVDVVRLVKLLNLSTSPEDGEALSAIRFANRLIKKHAMTWEDIIKNSPSKRKRPHKTRGQSNSPSAQPSSPKPEPKPDVKREPNGKQESESYPNLASMFEFLLRDAECMKHRDNRPFVKSVFEFWIQHGNISMKQELYIKEFYFNCLKKEMGDA